MRNDWKPRFKCTFKVPMTREAARRQARKYLKKPTEIISK